MLYIMRHGKTDWNKRHKIQGRTDIPLNDEGRKMAEEAREEYKGIHFDVCYCSPMIRARETAEIFLKGRDIPIIFDERLVEMGFGIYEGIEESFSIPDCPINVFFFHPEQYTTPVEGGESVDELFARTGEFLKVCVYPKIEEGKDVLIVGHGAMNLSIVCQVKNRPLSEFWAEGIPNCKLQTLIDTTDRKKTVDSLFGILPQTTTMEEALEEREF